MTITNGYTNLATLRFLLGITNASDTSMDTYLENAIMDVSREIDNWCKRRFYTTTEDETRYYTAMDESTVYTDDIVSITNVYIDEDADRTYSVTLATTDYDRYPINYSEMGHPITWLQTAPEGDYSFSTVSKGVKITGKFGYCALASVPGPIKQACNIQSARIYKRTKDAPFGVVGSSDMGQVVAITALDPDVQQLIAPYKTGGYNG